MHLLSTSRGPRLAHRLCTKGTLQRSHPIIASLLAMTSRALVILCTSGDNRPHLLSLNGPRVSPKALLGKVSSADSRLTRLVHQNSKYFAHPWPSLSRQCLRSMNEALAQNKVLRANADNSRRFCCERILKELVECQVLCCQSDSTFRELHRGVDDATRCAR